MRTLTSESLHIAMLIDGDNAQPQLLEHNLAETAKYGVVTTRRIYGDWTTPNMNGWKDALHSHAVQPAQQFRYTTGKNATDSALIIEAMDLLHGGTVSGFCIVSSDSDYTRLAMRVREQGLFVMGIGQAKTPKPFVNACEVFVYTENLSSQAEPKVKTTDKNSSGWTKTVAQAIDATSDDEGWALLAAVGDYLRKLDSAFDSRSYGHKNLSTLIKSESNLFETKGSGSSLKARIKA